MNSRGGFPVLLHLFSWTPFPPGMWSVSLTIRRQCSYDWHASLSSACCLPTVCSFRGPFICVFHVSFLFPFFSTHFGPASVVYFLFFFCVPVFCAYRFPSLFVVQLLRLRLYMQPVSDSCFSSPLAFRTVSESFMLSAPTLPNRCSWVCVCMLACLLRIHHWYAENEQLPSASVLPVVLKNK